MQYSKFIKNGWTILDTSQDIWTLAAMNKRDDSMTEIAVVTTNKDSSTTTTNWQFGSTPVQDVVEVYRTSATENCTRLTDAVLPSNGGLQYNLPGNSITTFYFITGSESSAATAG
jgi:O-glycosyl hydrolase